LAILVPWATIEIGDLEIFAPGVPCLVVNTWYIDGSAGQHRDLLLAGQATGLINHEIVFAGSVGFDAALAWAQEHAPTRGVERIHVKHGPSQKKRGRRAAKAVGRKKAAPRAKAGARAKVRRTKTPSRKTSRR
jgi:hypothetical protein